MAFALRCHNYRQTATDGGIGGVGCAGLAQWGPGRGLHATMTVGPKGFHEVAAMIGQTC